MALPIIFFAIAGLVFCLLSGAYAWQTIDDLQRDSFEFAIDSAWGTDWHRSFAVPDHPFLYAIRILMDATGAIGAFGLGLSALGALISISAKSGSPVASKMEAVVKPVFITALVAFGSHFVLVMVPYCLAIIGVLAP